MEKGMIMFHKFTEKNAGYFETAGKNPTLQKHIILYNMLTGKWSNIAGCISKTLLLPVKLHVRKDYWHEKVTQLCLKVWQSRWASQVALVVKKPPANAGDLRDACSTPGSGRSPGGGHGNPLQYSCLEKTTDRGAWRATVFTRVGGNWCDLAHRHDNQVVH